MNFAHPLAWLLLILLIPVALLYWLRVRIPSQTVGTGLFWQKALAEEKFRGRWQRWRIKVSVTLQMLLVVLLALAAAGPQIPASKRTVLIIDNSATMRATDVQPTRMDAAKEVARRLIESLRSCDEMAVVTVSPVPSEVQPLTSDQTLLMAAVNSVQAMAEPAAIDWAVNLAHEIGEPDKVSPRIVLITDACSNEATKLVRQSNLEVLRVGAKSGNQAITRFTARRSKAEPAKCEVLVEVHNQGDQLAKGSVTIAPLPGHFPEGEGNQKLPSTSGKVVEKPPSLSERGVASEGQSFSIVKNGCWQQVFTLDLPVAARLTAKIEPGDAYIFDDTAVLYLPAAPPAHCVKLVAEERSCLKEILAANRRVELISDVEREKGQAGKPDVRKAIYIIDGKTAHTLPAGPALVFTPEACDLWQLGATVADPLVTRVDGSSPIMAGVQLFDAYLPEARQLQIAESVRAVARPILWAGKMPLGYAIDRPQGRVVVIAGDLATSNLSLQAAFPQLIAQSLDWLDGQEPWTDEVAGSSVPQAFQPDLSPLLARNRGVESTVRLESLTYGGTDLRVPSDIGSEASALVVQKPWPPLWIVPAMLAAVLLILEWCLYQRRWTS